ncbi:MAG TPA: hypothetical protein VMY77_15635 [Chitinophagaceae bacterium]|nr:hypothetical protein [Chitinophagaceae bacterium]
MKKLSVIIMVSVVCSVFFFSRCSDNNTAESNKSKDTILVGSKENGGYESQAKWGEHLVMIGACGDCHTPKKMGPHGPEEDSSLLLSGHPAKMPPPDVDRKEMESKGMVVTQTLTSWVGPWGISYTANLTSDDSGIGTWNEDQFIYAIRNGKLKGLPGSRDLLPPMPWQAIRNHTDDELKAIFAYLKSTKPINNIVPPPAPPVVQRQ